VSSNGPYNPSAATTDSAVGTVSWSGTANVYASDDSRAVTGDIEEADSYYLVITGFNAGVQEDDTIDGIVFQVEGIALDFAPAADNAVYMVKDGVLGSTNLAKAGNWSNTEETRNYGDSNELGGHTWTWEEVNASTTGIAISVTGGANSGDGVQFAIDHVKMTVYSTAGVKSIFTRAYLYNPGCPCCPTPPAPLPRVNLFYFDMNGKLDWARLREKGDASTQESAGLITVANDGSIWSGGAETTGFYPDERVIGFSNNADKLYDTESSDSEKSYSLAATDSYLYRGTATELQQWSRSSEMEFVSPSGRNWPKDHVYTEPRMIAVDKAGNVYTATANTAGGIASYTSEGADRWSNTQSLAVTAGIAIFRDEFCILNKTGAFAAYPKDMSGDVVTVDGVWHFELTCLDDYGGANFSEFEGNLTGNDFSMITTNGQLILANYGNLEITQDVELATSTYAGVQASGVDDDGNMYLWSWGSLGSSWQKYDVDNNIVWDTTTPNAVLGSIVIVFDPVAKHPWVVLANGSITCKDKDDGSTRGGGTTGNNARLVDESGTVYIYTIGTASNLNKSEVVDGGTSTSSVWTETTNAAYTMEAICVLQDGANTDIYVGGDGGASSGNIFKYDKDGTEDTTESWPINTGANTIVKDLYIEDGVLYALVRDAGNTSHTLNLYNPTTGELDETHTVSNSHFDSGFVKNSIGGTGGGSFMVGHRAYNPETFAYKFSVASTIGSSVAQFLSDGTYYYGGQKFTIDCQGDTVVWHQTTSQGNGDWRIAVDVNGDIYSCKRQGLVLTKSSHEDGSTIWTKTFPSTFTNLACNGKEKIAIGIYGTRTEEDFPDND